MSETAAAAGSAGQTTETTQAVGAQPSGMPQFRFESWPGQVVWSLIVFVVLYLVLSKVFLPRVGRTMEARDKVIADDVAAARALRDQAQAEAAAAQAEMDEAHAQAEKVRRDAKARANAEATRRRAELEAELNVQLSDAEGRIAHLRDEAMGEVKKIAPDAAAAIAEKLTGMAATTAEVEQAMAERA